MHNEYIEYLKSMNNASSSNDNAIAESQITNMFYEKIRVERAIGNYLIDSIKEEPTLVILTGHAGDGKTSLLHQILRKLNLIAPQQKLEVSSYIQTQIGKSENLFYVKDMSELIEVEQVSLLESAIENRHKGGSSVVISNTGPIIETFKKMVQKKWELTDENDQKIIKVEMDVLKLLDENHGMIDLIGSEPVLLVNLAKIDNTDIIPELIEKILDPELWNNETGCSKQKQYCPIYNNYLHLMENKEFIKQFVQAYYRWLYENDSRLTIRQILSHLTYAITGNLECDTKKNLYPQKLLFEYHFANLFFGYIGFDECSEANKIRGISEIKKMKMDEQKLQFDYNYFVREQLDSLLDSVSPTVDFVWTQQMKRKFWKTEDILEGERLFNLRKSLRRFQILFTKENERNINQLFSDLFSSMYPVFLKSRTKKLDSRELRHLKPMVMKALQVIIIGSEVKNSSKDPLFLPLKKVGINNQNVYLLMGEVPDSDVSVAQEKVSGLFGESDYYQLVIKFKRINEEYPISLLLLDYFAKMAKGSLATKLSSSISHGIDKMKAKLYSEYRYDESENIHLLVRTLNCIKKVDLGIEEDFSSLYIE